MSKTATKKVHILAFGTNPHLSDCVIFSSLKRARESVLKDWPEENLKEGKYGTGISFSNHNGLFASISSQPLL